jgi:GT2 family glycosyltransferase
MLDRLGAFDPRYFLYFEETDLWLRAQRAGWEVWALGEAVATHQANASARKTGLNLYNGCIAEHYFRSRFHYMAENFGVVAAFAAEVIELAVMSLRAAVRTARRQRIHAYWTRVGAPVLGRPAQESRL